MKKFDIVIPCHPKDKDVLHKSIQSLSKLSNKQNVYIVSPAKIDIDENFFYINDNEFDEHFTISKIKERWTKECSRFAYRASWIYQQLIKLYAHKVIKNLSKSYLILDSDTIVTNDLHIDPDKFQYCIAKENHQPYKTTFNKLTKINALNFSFIYHHMLFTKNIVEELLNYVEKLHKKSFVDALLDSMSYDNQSPFSEWDTYGNWVYLNHYKICVHRQLRSTDLCYIPNENQLQVLSKNFDLVSSHGWLRGIEAQ